MLESGCDSPTAPSALHVAGPPQSHLGKGKRSRAQPNKPYLTANAVSGLGVNLSSFGLNCRLHSIPSRQVNSIWIFDASSTSGRLPQSVFEPLILYQRGPTQSAHRAPLPRLGPGANTLLKRNPTLYCQQIPRVPPQLARFFARCGMPHSRP